MADYQFSFKSACEVLGIYKNNPSYDEVMTAYKRIMHQYKQQDISDFLLRALNFINAATQHILNYRLMMVDDEKRDMVRMSLKRTITGLRRERKKYTKFYYSHLRYKLLDDLRLVDRGVMPDEDKSDHWDIITPFCLKPEELQGDTIRFSYTRFDVNESYESRVQEPQECGFCFGRGVLYDRFGKNAVQGTLPCLVCESTGLVLPTVRFTDILRITRKSWFVDIDVSEIEHGKELIFKGQGHCGKSLGEYYGGDLHVMIIISEKKPDPEIIDFRGV